MPNDPTALTVIVVIIALVSVTKNVSDMISSWKRSPTVDRDLQNYMPRKELERNFEDLKEEDGKIWQRLNGMDRTNSKNQADIQRSLGRMEGKVDQIRNEISK